LLRPDSDLYFDQLDELARYLISKSVHFCPVKYIILTILLLSAYAGLSQKLFENKVYSESVRSPQAYPESNPLGYPIIAFMSGENLEFHFDIMTDDFDTYRYGVVHCDHEWRQSDIDANEYIQGFATDQISTIDAAFATMHNYVHYRFTYPNDMSKPVYSGNYAMVIYSGSDIMDETTWLITYRFVIYESTVSITSRVGQSSIISERFSSQEVDFEIGYKDFQIFDPMRDINVTILQNFDWKRSVNRLKPIFLKPDLMTFDYSDGQNSFEAGNEWRFFEVKDTRYISSEVQGISLEDDGYHIYLRPDIIEGKRAYSTWQDINGNFLVKNDQGDDAHLEADYVWVHFGIIMPEAEEAEVLLEGKFNEFGTPKAKCVYDKASQSYQCKLLLKQGYYNYRYMLRDKFYAKDNIRFTEGSHAATENVYHIIAYMYDRNRGCDRIIAVKADRSVN